MTQEFFKEIIKEGKLEKIADIVDKKPGEADSAPETARCGTSLEFMKEMERTIIELAYAEKKNRDNIKKSRKDEFIKKYPDQEKASKIIFDLEDIFELQKKIARQKEKDITGKPEDFIKLAKWQRDATEFMVENKNSETYLRYFRKIFNQIAKNSDFKKEADGLKAGLLGQVELWHLLKEAGFNPKLASPEEDAFRQTDIWLELPNKQIALQIKKEKSAPKQPLIKSTEEITYPAILMKIEGAEYYFSTRDIEQMLRFKRNCKKLSEEKHSDVKGLYVILPEGETNPITGAPSEKMIEAFKKEIGNRIEIDRN